MKEIREIHGSWHIRGPDNPPQFGILRFNPETGLELTVWHLDKSTVEQILSAANETTEFPKTLHGEDDSDRNITLFGCVLFNSNTKAGMRVYTILPLLALLGAKETSWREASYKTVHVHFSLLHNWLGRTGFVNTATGTTVNSPGDVVLLQLDNCRASAAYSFQIRHDSGIATLSEDHVMCFTFSKKLGPKQILDDFVTIFQRVLTLFSGKEIYADKIVFYSEGPRDSEPIELLRNNSGVTQSERKVLHPHMLIPFPEISNKAGEIIARWFGYHERLDAVLDLYFATVFNRHLHSNLEFLLLAQALEVYHTLSPSFEKSVSPPAEFKKRRDAILEKVPEESKWLTEKLAFANMKTLAQRLGDILNAHPGDVDQFIPDLKDFADKIRHTRNYYTHFTPELKEKKKIAEGEDLLLLTVRMRALLELSIVKDLGITGAPTARIIARANQMSVTTL